jgi:hypothetical protein
MFQHVNSIFVTNVALNAVTGNEATELKNATNFPVGTLFIVAEEPNGARNIVTDPGDIDSLTKYLQIGLVTGRKDIVNPNGTTDNIAIVQYSKPIQRGSLTSIVNHVPVAPTEDEIRISVTAATLNPLIQPGYRYVLRIQRNDIYEHPGKQTYSYEVIAAAGETSGTLMVKFATLVNKDSRPGVLATALIGATPTLTLAAKPKDDNDGKHPYNLYSQIDITAQFWYTIPDNFPNNNAPAAVPSAVIEKTPHSAGHGNWKVVRDRENAALGYRGITYRANAVYPYIAPELNVAEGGSYYTIVFEHNNLYRSNDNQYIKDTPLAVEIYSTHDSASIVALIKHFSEYGIKPLVV